MGFITRQRLLFATGWAYVQLKKNYNHSQSVRSLFGSLVFLQDRLQTPLSQTLLLTHKRSLYHPVVDCLDDAELNSTLTAALIFVAEDTFYRDVT